MPYNNISLFNGIISFNIVASPPKSEQAELQSPGAMATRQVPMLSLEAAKVAVEGAQEKAKQMGMGNHFTSKLARATF